MTQWIDALVVELGEFNTWSGQYVLNLMEMQREISEQHNAKKQWRYTWENMRGTTARLNNVFSSKFSHRLQHTSDEDRGKMTQML